MYPSRTRRRPRAQRPIGDQYARVKADILAAAKATSMRGTITGQGSSNKFLALAPTGEGVSNGQDYAVVEPALHTQVIGVPHAAVGAALGTGPPAPIVAAGSLDTRGIITFGTGTGSSNGVCVAVTFGTPFRVKPFIVFTDAVNGRLWAVSPYIDQTLISTTGFSFCCLSALTDGLANTFYGFAYHAYSSAMGFVQGDSGYVEETGGGSFVLKGKIN